MRIETTSRKRRSNDDTPDLPIYGAAESSQKQEPKKGGDDGGENACLAIGGEHGAVSLAGDAPGLECKGASAPVDFYDVFIKHVHVPLIGEDTRLARMAKEQARSNYS